MIHDAKKDKPYSRVGDGLSTPVTLFTDNGMVVTGWWDNYHKFWCDLESDGKELKKEWFGNVLYWADIEFPEGWHYDDEVYR